MEAPITSSVSIEQVMATQTKRLASGAVGSIASNVLIDEYDMNPYIAMGINNITYSGLETIGNIEYVNGFGAKPVEAASMDRKKLDTSILDRDKKSMTDADLRELREIAKQMDPTPENAIRIGSEKTWNEF
ncbi:MAG TPA: hypothetical protein VK071_12415 [Tissierellales bacterium]|nr:hypothetical protein [Tissierellales bacterium]